VVMMKNSNHVLTAENLHKQYGKRWVVRAVDIEVKKGEIVGLLGPNGAGKTTTFYMITGMIKPTKGRIFLDKKEITQDVDSNDDRSLLKEIYDEALSSASEAR